MRHQNRSFTKRIKKITKSEELTSQHDDTLRKSIRQQLEEFLETNEGEHLLRNIVGRITLGVPRDREGPTTCIYLLILLQYF